jgi:hypothetical protein
MLRKKICDLLGIEVPIIGAPMAPRNRRTRVGRRDQQCWWARDDLHRTPMMKNEMGAETPIPFNTIYCLS